MSHVTGHADYVKMCPQVPPYNAGEHLLNGSHPLNPFNSP